MLHQYLSTLAINNFRVFSEQQQFYFHPITVLTGKNSSGKSSLIRSIQLMNHFLNESDEISFANNIQVSKTIPFLGDFSMLLPFKSKNKSLEYAMPLKITGINETLVLEVEYSLSDSKTKGGRLNKIVIKKLSDKEEIFSTKFINKNSYDITIDLLYFFENYKKECKIFTDYLSDEIENSPAPTFYKFLQGITELKHIKHLMYEGSDELLNISYEEFNNNIEAEEKWAGKVKSKKNFELQKKEFLKDFSSRVYHFKEGRPLNEQEKKLFLDRYDDPIMLGDAFNFNFPIDFQKFISIKSNSTHSSIFSPHSYIQKSILFSFLLSENKILLTDDGQDEWALLRLNLSKKEMSKRVKNFKISGYAEFKNVYNMFYSSYWSFHTPSESGLKYEFIKKLKTENEFDFDNYIGEEGVMERFDYFVKYFIEENIIRSISSQFIGFFKSSEFVLTNRNELKRSYSDDSFGNLLYEILDQGVGYNEFINKYLQFFEIGTEILLERDVEGEFTRVYLIKDKIKTLLADLGYGISQILPILFKIVIAASKQINGYKLFIEEPESNLHPALQSKLANLFIEASEKFSLTFVLETHSEYLIRKLQYLTARGAATTDDTIIYYFNPPENIPEGENQVKEIRIREDGSMTNDFGHGFFDEADQIALDLFLLNQSQKN